MTRIATERRGMMRYWSVLVARWTRGGISLSLVKMHMLLALPSTRQSMRVRANVWRGVCGTLHRASEGTARNAGHSRTPYTSRLQGRRHFCHGFRHSTSPRWVEKRNVLLITDSGDLALPHVLSGPNITGHDYFCVAL